MHFLVPGRCFKSIPSFGKHLRGLQTTNKRGMYYNPAYFHQLGKERLVYRNLGQQLRRAADKYGQRAALISCAESKELSFEAVRTEAGILGHHLLSLGLQRGDHVGLWAPNTTQFYVSCLAAALVGMPLVCINPALQAEELKSALRQAKVKALIGMDACGKYDFVQVLEQVLPELKANQPLETNPKLPDLKVLLLKSPRSWQTAHDYDALLTQNRPHTHEVAFLYLKSGQIPAEGTCNLQFTSGTTGLPKVALFSHLSYVNQGHLFGRCMELQAANRRICCPLPLFHAFGMSLLVAALDYGATVVLPSASFNAAAALEAIEQHSCNIVLGTPTMYADMLQKQSELNHCMDSLELGVVGGAPASPKLLLRVREAFGLKSFKVGYGLTETCGAVFMQDGEEQPDQAMQTVGRLFDHSEAKVINAKGETVNFGERGELCLRGYFTMQGYFEDEERTQQVLLKDGWLRTGDEFVLEENGVGSVVGRKKEVIIRGGENIFPKQVEDALLQHKDILEAQVIGVPDERLGEELCAYLRLRPGGPELTTEDVHAFCKGRLAHFKIPRYVRILQEFPKTTSGKIQKFKLLEMFAGEGQS